MYEIEEKKRFPQMLLLFIYAYGPTYAFLHNSDDEFESIAAGLVRCLTGITSNPTLLRNFESDCQSWG